jgi:hypothetical protein
LFLYQEDLRERPYHSHFHCQRDHPTGPYRSCLGQLE